MATHPNERRMRAIVTNEGVEYVHNDLATACFFFRQRLAVAVSQEAGGEPAYTYVMALVTMLAFTLEGYVTFIGDRLIKSGPDEAISKLAWNTFERLPVKKKIKEIARIKGATIDWNVEPYTMVDQLVGLRDSLAHPKAYSPKQPRYEAEGTERELRQMLRDYEPEHARQLTPQFANKAADAVSNIWDHLLGIAGISLHETWGVRSQGLEFLHHIDE